MLFFNQINFNYLITVIKLQKLFKIKQNLINTHYFYRNSNFTDTGLTNFGKSLSTLPTLNSLSLDFYL